MKILSLLAFIYLALLTATIIYIPVSWDEGWNFCVARTLLEYRHYGCMLSGDLTTARLSTGWPSVLPSALGFLISNNSYIGARIFTGIQTFLALLVLIVLAKNLFSARIAVATGFLLLLISGDQRLNPLFLGGQAWGEMPMVLAVSLGFLALMKQLQSRQLLRFLLFAALSGIFFGYALTIKIQIQPFLLCASAVTCLVSLYLRRWRQGAALIMVGFLSYLAWKQLLSVPLPYSTGKINYSGAGTEGIYEAVAVVTDPRIRKINLLFSLKTAWLLWLTIPIFSLFIIQKVLARDKEGNCDLEVKIGLFSLSASWFLWFVFLAVNFPRYLAPALIFGAPFMAKVLSDWTFDFDFEKSRVAFRNLMNASGRWPRKIAVLVMVIFCVTQAVVSAFDAISFMWTERNQNRDLMAVAAYINDQTPVNALVETYDSQLFYLLDRKYHYPPDQVNVDSIAISSGNQDKVITYSPLEANPDYLVVGPWSRYVFKIYDSVLATDAFRETKVIGDYAVYARNR